jgi:small conductance mechanosensitive channel
MEESTNWFTEHGIPILIVVVGSFIGYQILKAAINRVMHRIVNIRGKGRRAKEELDKRSNTLSGYLSTVLGAIVLFVAVFMILSEVGVDIAPLIAGAGVVGIAIGFGAQSLIQDYLNGLFIVIEDQYNKGDVAKIAGIAGLVESVSLRRTVLRDLDGIVHSIPNGQITTTSNYTRDWARVNLNISVGYGEDLDRVMAVIDRVGRELAEDEYYGKLIKTPPKSLRVNKFGDSGIDIKILGETKPIKQWEVTGELRRRLKRAFDEEGIEIPWPHVKLYFGAGEPEMAPTKADPATGQRPEPFNRTADLKKPPSGDGGQDEF